MSFKRNTFAQALVGLVLVSISSSAFALDEYGSDNAPPGTNFFTVQYDWGANNQPPVIVPAASRFESGQLDSNLLTDSGRIQITDVPSVPIADFGIDGGIDVSMSMLQFELTDIILPYDTTAPFDLSTITSGTLTLNGGTASITPRGLFVGTVSSQTIDFSLNPIAFDLSAPGNQITMTGVFGHDISPTQYLGGPFVQLDIDLSLPFADVGGTTVIAIMHGEILATSLPEVGSITMAGMSAAGLVVMAIRKRRRKS